MSNAHPVLGYPTKSEAAWALWRQGLRQGAIAEQLGVKENTVGNLIRHGRALSRKTKSFRKTDSLDGKTRYRLQAAAQKRGIDTRTLVNRLLTALAHDKLLDAILDDGETQ